MKTNKHFSCITLATRILWTILFACALINITGCASTPQTTGNNPQIDSEIQMLKEQSARIIAEAKLQKNAADIIRQNDTISIQVWLRDKKNQMQGFPLKEKIPGSGSIFIPDIGPTKIIGRTDAELTEQLTLHFGKILNEPTVVVEHEQESNAKQADLTERHVTIMGWIKQPGLHPFREGMTIRDLVAAAGGTTIFANTKGIYVVRGSVDNPEVIRVNLKKIVKGENIEGNVHIEPNDAVYVPSVAMWKAYDVIRIALLPLSAVRDAVWISGTTQ